jgi:hypothetical protein
MHTVQHSSCVNKYNQWACLKAVILCEVEVCVPSACYKQIIEAVNRDNIAVLTNGETWGAGGRYTEEGDAEDTAAGQKKTGGEVWMKVVIRTKFPLCE